MTNVRAVPVVRALGPHVCSAQPAAAERGRQGAPRDADEPHYYLAILGADPLFQRSGRGQRRARSPMLERCDTEGVPAYLETQKEENLAYYAAPRVRARSANSRSKASRPSGR